MVSCPKYPVTERTQGVEQEEIKRHISKAEHMSSIDEALGQISYNERVERTNDEIK